MTEYMATNKALFDGVAEGSDGETKLLTSVAQLKAYAAALKEDAANRDWPWFAPYRSDEHMQKLYDLLNGLNSAYEGISNMDGHTHGGMVQGRF